MSDRLTDMDLDALIQHGCSSGTQTPPLVRDAIIKAGLELRSRRAADLSDEEREALRSVVDLLRADGDRFPNWMTDEQGAERVRDRKRALATLDRLLGRGGGK